MSVFSKAKVMKEPEKANKKSKQEIIAVQRLGDLCAINTVINDFLAIKETIEADVKADMVNTFVGIGKQTKKRPDNFRGVDTNDANSSASCQLRARSSRSALTEDEVGLLTKNNIPVGEIVDKEDCYVINPKYFSDQDLLEKVSKVLDKVKGLPEDFIVRQECSKRKVVTDETVNAVFEKGKADTLLDIVCVPAITPKFTGTLAEALKKLGKLRKHVKL